MKYKRSDFRDISWEAYGDILESLHKKVKAYVNKEHIKIDMVVPILRGGSFPGTFLAYKFSLLRICPIQFKYISKEGKLQLIKINTIDAKKDVRVVLVVENNHCYGGTAKRVIKEVQRKLPNAKILYAAAFMDASNIAVEGVDKVFYAALTNETGALSKAEMKRKSIDGRFTLFPWENIAEELAVMNGVDYVYTL
jgi:hypoxanthine phosphoribosyltransferase